MCGRTELHTCIGKGRLDDLKGLAASFGFKLKPLVTEQTISFEYFHGLSAPVVRPLTPVSNTRPTIEVKGKAILRYGMIEADAVVRGARVVYDPQSVFDPEVFAANGSTAEKLAVVLNMSEGRKLTNRLRPESVSTAVLTLFGADVVVLKQGAAGALVITRGGRSQMVPAYETSSVFPIGSGDVFSAAFAAKWAVKKEDAVAAARYASLAAAYYCSTKTLPLPKAFNSASRHNLNLRPIKQRWRAKRRLVYLAGPFFNVGQRWLIEEAKGALESQGLQVFSPFHDVGMGHAEHVVPEDLKGIQRAHVMYAVIDGLDPGTLFEIGYARARGIPVIAFTEQEEGESLKLLQGSGCKIEKDFTTSIYRTSWLANAIS